MAEQKPAAAKNRKPAVKKPENRNIMVTAYLEANGKQVKVNELTKKAAEHYESLTGKKADELSLYVKPEESMVYYVANKNDCSENYKFAY
jgi:hypothetical protein